jgi:hypothetical protein
LGYKGFGDRQKREKDKICGFDKEIIFGLKPINGIELFVLKQEAIYE